MPVRCVQTGAIYPSVMAALADNGIPICGAYYRDALEGYPVTKRGLLFDPIEPDDPDWHRRPKRRSVSPRSRPVRCIETGQTYPSAAAASRALGVCRNSVYQAIYRCYRAGGYRWEWVA